MHPTAPVGGKLFALLCLASYLLSLSYGSTFLLSLLIDSRGGNEHDAGSVISMAMLSTFIAVIVSGHLADALGAARAIACLGSLLVAACLGFALTPGFGQGLMLFGLALGLGWGCSIPWARSSWRCWCSPAKEPNISPGCRAA